MSAISCPSQSLCVAVGRGYFGSRYIAVSRDPTGGADAWTVTNTAETFTSNYYFEPPTVSCASSSLCVVTDEGGNVLTSTDPAGGLSAWRSGSVPTAGYNSLQALSCPSRSFCAALDNAGNLLTSTRAAALAGPRAWKTVHFGAPDATSGAYVFGSNGISCPSASFCAALDKRGDLLTSNRPAGGARAWTATRLSSPLSGVSCPRVSLCVAASGGDILASSNPAAGASAWTLQYTDTAQTYRYCGHQPRCPTYVFAVTCRSARLCVALDSAGDVLSSTDPAGGSGAWQTHVVTPCLDGCGLGTVSCPSVSFCVAAGDFMVYTSHNPASGVWKISTPFVPAYSSPPILSPQSCPSGRLCVGINDRGDFLVSTRPANRWSHAYLKQSGPFGLYGYVTMDATGVSCPSALLCVAIDGHGRVIVGNRTSAR